MKYHNIMTKEQLINEIETLQAKNAKLLSLSNRSNKQKDAIQKSQSILVSAVNSLDNLIMFALDADYNYISFNNAHVKEMKRIYDCDIELGKYIFSYMPNDDRSKAEINYKRVLQGERFIEIQDYGVDNNRFWYELIFNPLFDTSNNVTGFSVFVTEITKRKQAEITLKESEEIFSSFVKSAIDGIVMYDAELNLVEINRAALEIFPEGSTKENLIGKNILDMAPSIKKSGCYDKYINVLKTGKSLILNDIIPDPVYGNRYLNLKAFRVGSGLGIIFTDVTERKRYDDEMADQKQLLANILEGTNAGIWDWNIITDELAINERWAEIMGFTLKELAPIDVNTWVNNVHPDDLPDAKLLLDKLFAKEIDYYDIEFRQPHKNGGWIWVNARGKIIEWTDDGKPARISGTHLDITERKKVQEELKKHHNHLEELVDERTIELQEKNKKLDNAMKVFVGRELTIRDLQNRINAFEGK